MSTTSSTSSPTSSSSLDSPSDEDEYIRSLPPFAPIVKKITASKHNFYRIVLWTKSSFIYKDLQIPPYVPDHPPLGIHGFNPVDVSNGEKNYIISHKHRCREEKFSMAKHGTIEVIKSYLRNRLKKFWPALKRGSTLDEFLKMEAWKHNTNPDDFPDPKEYIAKGLEFGYYYITKIIDWMDHETYRFDSTTTYQCSLFKQHLSSHLGFVPDCRFYGLAHRDGLLGLKKIGVLGVVSDDTNFKKKFNPVNFQLDVTNLRRGEYYPEIPVHISDHEFILENLRASIQARANAASKSSTSDKNLRNKRKPPNKGGSSPSGTKRPRK